MVDLSLLPFNSGFTENVQGALFESTVLTGTEKKLAGYLFQISLNDSTRWLHLDIVNSYHNNIVLIVIKCCSSNVVDRAVEETTSLKREMSALEAQIPSEETARRQEALIKEELGAAWRQKLAAFSDENENLNDLVIFLQQVNRHTYMY